MAQAETLAFHLGGSDTTIDLDRLVSEDVARAAEKRTNDVVWAARPVRVTVLSADQARASGIEPPEGVLSGIRVVEAEGFDRQPCGGTHPRSTAEVGVVLVTALERYKGGTRVHFVCGDRATRMFAERQQVVGQLVATLSAPLEELPAAAQRLKDELADSERRAKALLARALEGDARRLLAEAQGAGAAPTLASPAVIVAVFDGWPADDLRVLAQQLVALAPCVALLASRSDKAQLVFAQSEGLPHDVPGTAQSGRPAPRRPRGRPRQPRPGRRRAGRASRGSARAAPAPRSARPAERPMAPTIASRARPVSPYATLVLGVLLVSVGAILVRLAAAPPLAVSFYRMAIASLLLSPFAWADARRSWPTLSARPAPAAAGLRRRAGAPLRHLDREPVAHLGGRLGAARQHGAALRDRAVARLPAREAPARGPGRDPARNGRRRRDRARRS